MTDVWVAPAVAGAFTLITGVILLVITRRNKKSETEEARMPSVLDAYDTLERYRIHAYFWRDAYFNLQFVVKAAIRRAKSMNPVFVLTDAERETINKIPQPPE